MWICSIILAMLLPGFLMSYIREQVRSGEWVDTQEVIASVAKKEFNFDESNLIVSELNSTEPMLEELLQVMSAEQLDGLEKQHNHKLVGPDLSEYSFYNVTYNSIERVDMVELLKKKGIAYLENSEKEKVFAFVKSEGHVGIIDGVFRLGKLRGFNHFYVYSNSSSE